MNEEQNVNTNPKPKKKRSFWWLKLLLILVIVAAAVIGGMLLTAQPVFNELRNEILDELFPQYAVHEELSVPVETVAPELEKKPVEFKPAVTATPKPSKAPVEIISPEAEEKAESKENAPAEEKPELSEEPAPVESPEASVIPAFAPVSPTPAPAEEKPEPTPGVELIGIDAALEAALEHAGAEKDEAIVYSVSREKDDGLVYYEVEFAYSGREYEYEINAYSGIVESWKASRDRLPSVAAVGTETEGDSSYVSLEDAKNAALEHAGYKEHETTDMKAALEIDKNKVVYDVEFWAEGYDYEYKVDAVSGLVLMVEKDRD